MANKSSSVQEGRKEGNELAFPAASGKLVDGGTERKQFSSTCCVRSLSYGIWWHRANRCCWYSL